MERQGLIKKAGYEYNRAGDLEQKYELTKAGDERFWVVELANLCDADRATSVKTREALQRGQDAMRARQQKKLNRQLKVLLHFLAKMQKWERRMEAMS